MLRSAILDDLVVIRDLTKNRNSRNFVKFKRIETIFSKGLVKTYKSARVTFLKLFLQMLFLEKNFFTSVLT